ncbi:MAG TPA: hypothetical protein VFZ25_11770 [Chloroflexota bacterium]|nr:hypothetical protein [Chloroflexota bacterium]
MGWAHRALLSLFIVSVLIASTRGRDASADTSGLSIESVQVTNLGDRGFYVTWTTDQLASSGAILYGTNPSSLISLVPEVMGPRADVHRVFVQPAAAPGTAVYFDVRSGTTVDNDDGSHYRVTLGQSIGSYPSPVTASGQVMQSDGRTAAVGVLVTLWAIDYSGLDGVPVGGTATSLPLSALTDSAGKWSLSVEPRTADGNAFFKYTTNGTDQIKYSVNGAGLGQTSATILPLVLAPNGQVTAPTVSLIGNAATGTPTQTPTNGPVATSTPSATPFGATTLTVSPVVTSAADKTPTVLGTATTPIATVPSVATIRATSTTPPTEEVPTPRPFPTSTPYRPPPVYFTPTAYVPPTPPPTNTPVATATPIPSPTLAAPLAIRTAGPGAWPDRSTPTATPTPLSSATPLAGDAVGGQSDGGLPAGISLLLIIGASFVGLGSLGVAVAVVEARREA